jgi:D-3-phosphoglycerate dehydrogenase
MSCKILLCDPIPDTVKTRLEKAGHHVDIKHGMTPEELAEVIAPYTAVVVRSATKVRKVAIEKAENLKVIVRGGVGIDNIDHEFARSKGIKVLNTPTATSNSVAELALGFMFALARHIPEGTITLRNGEWAKKQLKGTELLDKTLGLIGIGRIGAELAKKALALGMTVIAYDLFLKESPVKGVKMVTLDEALAKADYVSLHIPFDKEKGAAIGKAEFDKMKSGAYLINCARGGVVDEDAMLAALDGGKLAGAGIDVFIGEPTPKPEVVGHTKVFCTPHIGASTVEGQDRVADLVVDVLLEELG